jgi:hypothetical protein
MTNIENRLLDKKNILVILDKIHLTVTIWMSVQYSMPTHKECLFLSHDILKFSQLLCY